MKITIPRATLEGDAHHENPPFQVTSCRPCWQPLSRRRRCSPRPGPKPTAGAICRPVGRNARQAAGRPHRHDQGRRSSSTISPAQAVGACRKSRCGHRSTARQQARSRTPRAASAGRQDRASIAARPARSRQQAHGRSRGAHEDLRRGDQAVLRIPDGRSEGRRRSRAAARRRLWRPPRSRAGPCIASAAPSRSSDGRRAPRALSVPAGQA